MRGGFVVCLGSGDRVPRRLEAAVTALRWHAGEPCTRRHGGLHAAWLADELHGPTVEISAGRLLLCHGAPPEPLEVLERRGDRFVGLESDGVSLRAIRDRMGEVPLFYRAVGDELWLATEIHALLEVAPAEPDLDWVTAYSAMVEFPETTGWVGVKRLLPGEILEVERGSQVRVRRYFRPRLGARRGSPSPAEAAEQLRALFSAAVAKRSFGPSGVLLSGGLDSSAVAVVAARIGRPTLLTIAHPGLPTVDELPYARAVADSAGIPLTTLEVEPDPWDPADDIRTFGTPPVGMPTGMFARGLEALAAHGCVTALDGHDGDGTLGNQYAWTANTLLDVRPDRLVRAAREYGSWFILRETIRDFVPPSVWRRFRRGWAAPDSRATFLPYFRGETAKRLAAESRWRAPRSGWEYRQLRALLPPITQFFEEIELFGARFGIDVQHPFADRDLVDFAIALPHAVKASTMRLKPVLRGALADLLPPTVAARDDKTGFTAVIDARVDFDACYRLIRDSGVRLPDLDYGRLFRDAARPVNNRAFWVRLTNAHVFLAGGRG